MNKVELLAPAGNFSKFLTAIRFGADAVYIGGKSMSLRALSENFTHEEIKKAAQIAHYHGKKLYVTVNVFARNADLSAAEEYFKFLQDAFVDAAIVSDPGLIRLAKKSAPALPLHLSTQANTTNFSAVDFWAEQGVERVVLARELSLNEIAEISKNTSIELEAFVHGAMCISYSGRCLLSNYLTGRDSNKGACVQACRWSYDLREHAKGGDWLTAEEDDRGTYVLNSKDLNMISHLDELISSGVCSLKIEGRMKSEYYLATVINAYRRAIDDYYANGAGYANNPLYMTELKKTAHRAFTTAYMLGNNEFTVNYDDSQSLGDAAFIAYVLDYNKEEGYAIVEMRNRFKTGDALEVLSPTSAFGSVIEVERLEDCQGRPVEDAKLVQQKLRLYTSVTLSEGDFLRRAVKQ